MPDCDGRSGAAESNAGKPGKNGMRNGMDSESESRLDELFRRSLVNCGLTREEYDEIIALSAEGSITNPRGQLLLRQLNQFLAKGLIHSFRLGFVGGPFRFLLRPEVVEVVADGEHCDG